MKEHGQSSSEDDDSYSGSVLGWSQASQLDDWSPNFQSRLNELEQETQALSAALEELLSRSSSQPAND